MKKMGFHSNWLELYYVWKFGGRGECREAGKMRVVRRIAEGDSYHPPCLDVFNTNKRDGNN